MKTITIVTSNVGKVAQYTKLLREYLPTILVDHYPLDIIEPQETDLVKISQYKALLAWEQLQRPVLVDDGGHYFESCNNFPGALTKSVWFGLGVSGILKLTQENNRSYREVAVTYCDGPDIIQTFTGRTSGVIIPPHGPVPMDDPLPYNHMFKPDGCPDVYNNLSPEQINEQCNYRMQAIRKLARWLAQ